MKLVAGSSTQRPSEQGLCGVVQRWQAEPRREVLGNRVEAPVSVISK